MTSGAGPAISVVIPTYNRASILDQCLAHLARQDVEAGTFEVIVADDASTDDTADVVEAWTSGSAMPVRYVLCEKGFAGAARNRGAALARGDRLLFLGDDIWPDPDLMRQHRIGLDTFGPKSVLVGSVTLDGPRPLPPFMEFLEVSGQHHDFPTLRTWGAEPIPGRYFYACNASLPRVAFEVTGGFDETIQRAWEDTEYGLRLAASGWPLHFLPAAHGVHVHPQTVDRYVAFLRNGRPDVARAASKMRAIGENVPEPAPHAVLDRLVSDSVMDVATRLVRRTERRLPRRLRFAAYRRIIRYENRRALQVHVPH